MQSPPLSPLYEDLRQAAEPRGAHSMHSPPLSPLNEDLRQRAPARFWLVSIVFLHDAGDQRGRILHRESGRSEVIVTERPLPERGRIHGHMPLDEVLGVDEIGVALEAEESEGSV